MTLAIQTTNVTETRPGYIVEMQLSDDRDPETSEILIRLRVPLDTDLQYPRLADLQQVALGRVKALIDAEIHRLKSA